MWQGMAWCGLDDRYMLKVDATCREDLWQILQQKMGIDACATLL